MIGCTTSEARSRSPSIRERFARSGDDRDHDVEPVTRDQDFNALAVMAGLRLMPAPARR
jgi:hypothetical protein